MIRVILISNLITKTKAMKYFTGSLLVIFGCWLLSFSAKKTTETIVGNQKTIGTFSLNDINGNSFSLDQFSKSKGCIVIFTCNHCPFANLYQDRLNVINNKYKDLGFPLIAVNPISAEDFPEESIEALKQRVKEKNFNFPYLVDKEQKIAKLFAAAKTPHAFVLEKKDNLWLVRYNGAIDDNGAEPDKVKNAYLDNALTAILNGKEVDIKETKSIGCAIQYKNKQKQ